MGYSPTGNRWSPSLVGNLASADRDHCSLEADTVRYGQLASRRGSGGKGHPFRKIIVACSGFRVRRVAEGQIVRPRLPSVLGSGWPWHRLGVLKLSLPRQLKGVMEPKSTCSSFIEPSGGSIE
jgi:hypothetical protein